MDYNELMDMAKKASENSYSPYSKFPVGACVLAESGKTYIGNLSYVINGQVYSARSQVHFRCWMSN